MLSHQDKCHRVKLYISMFSPYKSLLLHNSNSARKCAIWRQCRCRSVCTSESYAVCWLADSRQCNSQIRQIWSFSDWKSHTTNTACGRMTVRSWSVGHDLTAQIHKQILNYSICKMILLTMSTFNVPFHLLNLFQDSIWLSICQFIYFSRQYCSRSAYSSAQLTRKKTW